MQTEAGETIRVNQWLEAGTFNRFHLRLFALLCVLITMDGYDLYVYGAAIPLLMRSFGISAAHAGVIGSAASAGTLVGALVFGPLADKIGRKNAILGTTVLCCASMAGAGLTESISGFAFWRFMFGLGNGGMVPSIMALASEYFPRRRRATAVACISAGVSFGGMLGALLGIVMFPRYGWRPVFFVAAAPIVLAPICAKWLPEATGYLARKNRLGELREYLSKARPGESLPEDAVLEVDKGTDKVPLKEVFHEGRLASTLVLWVVYGVNLYVMYGFTIWLPKLMMNQGFSLTSGLTFMMTLSVASIFGSFVVGRTADRVGARWVLVALYLTAFASISLIAQTRNAGLLMVLVGLAGIGFNGAQNTINSYIPAYYPPSMRSTAMAYNFGFGRLGSIVGPTAVGVLMSMQFSYQATVTALAVPSIITAVGILCVRERHGYGRKHPHPNAPKTGA